MKLNIILPIILSMVCGNVIADSNNSGMSTPEVVAVTATAAAATGGIIAAIISSTRHDDNPTPDALDKQLQALLDQHRTNDQIVNMSMSVSLNANSATRNYTSGTIELGGSAPVTPNTLFELGSITKSFTNAVILQLEAEGKLDITKALDIYLPDADTWYPKWSKVTLVQLMNMTSAIYDYPDSDFEKFELIGAGRHKTWSLKEIADYTYADHSDLLFTPGDHWYYSNTAYTLLGMIIEKITGHTAEYEFESRLLGTGPTAGIYYLPYAAADYPSYVKAHLAEVYSLYDSGSGYMMHNGFDNFPTLKIDLSKPYGAIEFHDVTDVDISYANTGGAMIADPKDLVTWVRDLFGGNVLRSTQFIEMTTQYEVACSIPPSGTKFALGLLDTLNFSPQSGVVIPGHTWWYEGGTYGGMSVFILLPDGAVITISTGNNADPSKGDDASMLLNAPFVEQVVMAVENFKNQ